MTVTHRPRARSAAMLTAAHDDNVGRTRFSSTTSPTFCAVPSFGVPALSTSNSNFLTSASGINTLQLRNLEADRTLVLINGRRYVSGLAGSSAVGFNTIPVALVERIEIITGGASAI